MYPNLSKIQQRIVFLDMRHGHTRPNLYPGPNLFNVVNPTINHPSLGFMKLDIALFGIFQNDLQMVSYLVDWWAAPTLQTNLKFLSQGT